MKKTTILDQLVSAERTLNELTPKEVNELAVLANDDVNAMWFTKAFFAPFIESKRESGWHKMNNEAHFLNDCEGRIEYAVRKYDASKGDFANRVHTLINQGLAKYCGKKRSKHRKMFDMECTMQGGNDAETSKTFETTVTEVRELDGLHQATDSTSVYASEVEELKAIYCAKPVDETIVDIILKDNTHGGLTHYEIARRLADITGKSFNSARSALRTFIKNKKAEVAF